MSRHLLGIVVYSTSRTFARGPDMSESTSPPPTKPGGSSEEAALLFAPDGTDLTQIRQMLAMSPSARVRYIQSLAQSITRLRRGVRFTS